MSDPQSLAKNSLIEEDFLTELYAKGLSKNTLKNYQLAVETLTNLDKKLENVEKKDIMNWASYLRENFSEGTQNLYKTCVRRYIKWVKTGDLNGDGYPKCVQDLQTSNAKSKKLPNEILSHEEVKEMAEVVKRQRDRAMIWVGYESGCRPGELLDMKIKDVEFDKFGAQIMVDGKTGERRIRLVESVPDLKNWLSMHPQKDEPEADLWLSNKGGSLSQPGWYMNLDKYAEKAGIKKNVHPHLLRHSRATHLASKGINEAQLREIFGWTKNSDMPSVYVHLSGKNTDSSILKLYDIEVEASENQLEMSVKNCSFCGHENSPNAKFCEECNGPLDSMAAEQSDQKVRQQDEHASELLAYIKENHPEAIIEFYEEQGTAEELQKLADGSKAEA